MGRYCTFWVDAMRAGSKVESSKRGTAPSENTNMTTAKDHLIIITEARVAGLGLNGGKRVRAAAIAGGVVIAHAAELVAREIKSGGAGRACVVAGTRADWATVLAG